MRDCRVLFESADDTILLESFYCAVAGASHQHGLKFGHTVDRGTMYTHDRLERLGVLVLVEAKCAICSSCNEGVAWEASKALQTLTWPRSVCYF